MYTCSLDIVTKACILTHGSIISGAACLKSVGMHIFAPDNVSRSPAFWPAAGIMNWAINIKWEALESRSNYSLFLDWLLFSQFHGILGGRIRLIVSRGYYQNSIQVCGATIETVEEESL
jgi:hypothetical protein